MKEPIVMEILDMGTFHNTEEKIKGDRKICIRQEKTVG